MKAFDNININFQQTLYSTNFDFLSEKVSMCNLKSSNKPYRPGLTHDGDDVYPCQEHFDRFPGWNVVAMDIMVNQLPHVCIYVGSGYAILHCASSTILLIYLGVLV